MSSFGHSDMSVHVSRTDNAVFGIGRAMMAVAPRISAARDTVLRLAGKAADAWSISYRRPTVSSRWFLGMSCIVLATILFLTVALSLGFILSSLRTKLLQSQHTQTVLMKTVAIEEDLDNADAAARRFMTTRDHADARLIITESQSARRRMVKMATQLQDNPDAAQRMRTVTPVIEKRLQMLGAIAAGAGESRPVEEAKQDGYAREVSSRLSAFRTHERAKMSTRQTEIDENILFAMGLALLAALAGPAPGLLGIYLLRREHDTQQARELQKELMHVQRLAVMGETAAMLAHEVSHPLTAANNYMAALKRMALTTPGLAPEKSVEMTERALSQMHRASLILQRLRRFIEKREAERSLESPAVLIEDAIALLGPIGNGVELRIHIEPDLPEVLVDRVQIQQVLVNLMRNGIEAMQQQDCRKLSVSAVSPEPGFVLFSLIDTGGGLSPAIAARLFQPFLSTKKDGMGVGLSICRSIVQQHKGTIWAEANPDGGTIFRFRLPA